MRLGRSTDAAILLLDPDYPYNVGMIGEPNAILVGRRTTGLPTKPVISKFATFWAKTGQERAGGKARVRRAAIARRNSLADAPCQTRPACVAKGGEKCSRHDYDRGNVGEVFWSERPHQRKNKPCSGERVTAEAQGRLARANGVAIWRW